MLGLESNGVGLSSAICKMRLVLVRADGLQGSLHFKHAKLLDQSYLEFLLIVAGLPT